MIAACHPLQNCKISSSCERDWLSEVSFNCSAGRKSYLYLVMDWREMMGRWAFWSFRDRFVLMNDSRLSVSLYTA